MENELKIKSQESSADSDRLLSLGKSSNRRVAFNTATTCDLIIKSNIQKYHEHRHIDIVNNVHHFPRLLGEAIGTHDSQARRSRTKVCYKMCRLLKNPWMMNPEERVPPHIRMISEKRVLSKSATTSKEISAFLRSIKRVSSFTSSENPYKKLDASVLEETPELSSLRKESPVSTPKGSLPSLPSRSSCDVVQPEERAQKKDRQENKTSVSSGTMVNELKDYGPELLCSMGSKTSITHEFERMSGFSSLCETDQTDPALEKRLFSTMQQNQNVFADVAGNLAEQLCKRQGETSSKKVTKDALSFACPAPSPGTHLYSSSRKGREGSSRFVGGVEGVLYFENFVPKRNPNSAMPNVVFIELSSKLYR